MSQASDIWEVPATPIEIKWLAQIAWVLILVAALCWLAFTTHDLFVLGNFSVGHTMALLSLLPWSVLAWKTRPQKKKASYLALRWCEKINRDGTQSSLHKQTLVDAQDSHWQTVDGHVASVSCKMDVGNYLLINIVVGQADAYHWVSDRALAGPWRWRIMASPSREQQVKQKKEATKRIFLR